MAAKPEERHFKNSNQVVKTHKGSNSKGAGQKIGAPVLAEVRKDDGQNRTD